MAVLYWARPGEAQMRRSPFPKVSSSMKESEEELQKDLVVPHPTSPRALPPLPFPREELKMGFVGHNCAKRVVLKTPKSASTRLRDFGTFCGGENG
jgi:hypothetical protein